jgi:hypothetical protein
MSLSIIAHLTVSSDAPPGYLSISGQFVPLFDNEDSVRGAPFEVSWRRGFL